MHSAPGGRISGIRALVPCLVLVFALCAHDAAEVRESPPVKRELTAPKVPRPEPEPFTLADDPGWAPRPAPSPDYSSVEAAMNTDVVFQRSHEKGIVDVKISPDGRLMVSASMDRTIKIWNSEGVLLRTVSVQGADFRCLAVSPDGTRIAAGAKNALYVLSIGGRLTDTFTGPENDTGIIAWSRDGSSIITSGGYETVMIRDNSWKVRATVKAADGFIKHIAVSPDGARFITCGSHTRSKDGWNATARLWDMKGGLVADLETDRPEQAAGRRGFHEAVAADISPDGSLIALLGSNGTLLHLRNLKGELLRQIEVKVSTGAQGCVFAPDGRGIILRGPHDIAKYGVDGSLKGIIKPSWPAEKPGRAREHGWMTCAAVSGDAKFMAAGLRGGGYTDGSIFIWDAYGTQKKHLRPVAYEARRVLFSPDASRLYLETDRGRHTIAWRLRRAYLDDIPEGVGFTSDGKEYRFYLDNWRNFHLKAGGRDTKFEGMHAVPLPDGTVLNFDRVIYDREGAAKRRLNFDTKGTGGLAPLFEIAVEAGMKYFVLETMTSHGGVHEITRYDAEGNPLNEINVEEALAGGAIAASGDLIATGHENGTVRVWTAGGKKLRTFSGHLLEVRALAFSPDRKYLASSSADRTTRVWNLEDGSSIVMAALPGGEWIAYDDTGRFECSDGARDQVRFVRGLTAYDSRQFWDTVHAPGLIAQFMKGVKAGASGITKAVRSAPEVSLNLKDNSGRDGTVTAYVCAKPRDNGVGKIFVLHNGRAVEEAARGVRVESRDGCRVFTFPLEPGENEIRGAAYDKSGLVFGASVKLAVRHKPPDIKKPDMYILAVGVSGYRDRNISLAFPADDARAVSGAFGDAGRELFGKIESRVLVDKEATRGGILAALGDIAKKAGKRDSVVVFLAGHGDTDGGMYYFLPHDADVTAIKSSGLSADDLGEFTRSLAAGKVVILLDTCKSGSAAGALHGLALARGFDDRKIIARLAKEHGIAVFSSASESQDAYEIRALRHGVFTWCLLEAFRGGDAAEEGVITIARLLARVSRTTRETAEKHLGIEQNPIVYIFGDDFAVGRAK